MVVLLTHSLLNHLRTTLMNSNQATCVPILRVKLSQLPKAQSLLLLVPHGKALYQTKQRMFLLSTTLHGAVTANHLLQFGKNSVPLLLTMMMLLLQSSMLQQTKLPVSQSVVIPHSNSTPKITKTELTTKVIVISNPSRATSRSTQQLQDQAVKLLKTNSD